jgi:hypothetical protein
MMLRVAVSIALAVLLPGLFSAAMAQSEAAPLRIETVSGQSLERGPLVEASAAELRFASGDPISLDDARTIRLASNQQAPSAKPASLVHLTGGGQLAVSDAILVDDACKVTFPDGRTATLELGDVAGIQWSVSGDPAWNGALAKPSDEHDFVVVQAAPAPTAIRAFVESITTESVEFDWDKETRTLPRAKVIGVVFARPEAPAGDLKLLLNMHDGGRLAARHIRRTEDGTRFQVELGQKSSLDLPVASVESITVRSSRVRYLSDQQPSEVHERPIVALPRSWQADHNVRGEPLKAGSAVYAKGIGVQSASSLTFNLEEHAEQFAAVLAVDSLPGTAGNCEFVVEADGRELSRTRARAGDQPVAIRVPLSGARRLTLRVDYGQNLDFGDHANWCDAHLVLGPAKSGTL